MEKENRWFLCENVFFVSGCVCSCIYDLNKGLLFWANNETTTFLNNLFNNSLNCENIDSKQAEIIKTLQSNELISQKFLFQGDIQKIYNKSDFDFIWIELTKDCNLKCLHCYENASSDSKKAKFISIDSLKMIATQIKSLGVKKIQFIGGEPLLNKSLLFEAIDIFSKVPVEIEVFTNGLLIDNEVAQKFKLNKVRVAISYYSSLEKEHDFITQQTGSHKDTRKAIEMLNRIGVEYRLASIETRYNRSKIEFPRKVNKSTLRITGRANIKLLNKLNIERKLITKNAFETELNIGFVKRAAKEHNCFGRRLYIDVDLNIFPCVMERRISHGNLKEGMLFDIINNEICTFNKDRIFVCKDCEFRYTCFDCRPDSLGKRIDEKPWYCTYDPHKGVWADKKLFVKNLLSKNKEGC